MRLITLTSITGAGEDMFDAYIETQTETAEEIEKTFPITGFNCVAILNTSGIEANLTTNGVNAAPTDCCIDPDNDENSTTGLISYKSAALTSVAGGTTGYALRITEDGEANPVAYFQMAVVPGEIYKFAGLVKAGTEASYQYIVYDVTHAYALLAITGTLEAAGDWSTGWDEDITIPAGCIKVQIECLQICSASSGTYIDFDNVSFKKQETQTVSLIRDSIKDWWDYYFAPIRTGKDVVFYFPEQSSGNATISIAYAGGTAKCGMCITGKAIEAGTTQWGVKVGITDYSKIAEDGFGQLYLNPGNWAKRADVDLVMARSQTDITYREMVKNRGTACIFDYNQYGYALTERHTSDNGLQALIVYGFTEDYTPFFNGPSISRAKHESQGLI